MAASAPSRATPRRTDDQLTALASDVQSDAFKSTGAVAAIVE
jgi:hypothetical protein